MFPIPNVAFCCNCVQYQFSWQFLLLTLELLSHAIFLLCSQYPLGVIRSLVLQQLVELLLSPKHGRGNTRTHLIHRIFHGLLGRSRAAGGGMLSRGWRWWRGNLNFHPWLRMSLQISMSRHFPEGISSIKNGFFLHVRTVSYKKDSVWRQQIFSTIYYPQQWWESFNSFRLPSIWGTLTPRTAAGHAKVPLSQWILNWPPSYIDENCPMFKKGRWMKTKRTQYRNEKLCTTGEVKSTF